MKFILIALLLAPGISVAQEINPGKSLEKRYLSLAENNKIINKYFGKVMGTGDNPDLLGNYASFDPADGKFTFKGTMPIGKKDSKIFSYIGISLSGDLLKENIGALFTQSKLNTGTSIQAEYHVRFGKAPGVRNVNEYALYNYRSKILLEEKTAAQNIAMDFSFRRTKFMLDSMAIKKGLVELKDKKIVIENLEEEIRHIIKLDKVKQYADSMKKYESAFLKESKRYDSLSNVLDVKIAKIRSMVYF